MADSLWRHIDWWIHPGVSLPTACGGELRVLEMVRKIECAFEITAYQDRLRKLIRFCTRLADQNGQLWECEEFIDPVAFYRRVVESASLYTGMGAEEKRGLKHAFGRYIYTPLFGECSICIDTRVMRVFAVQQFYPLSLTGPSRSSDHFYFRIFEHHVDAMLNFYEVGRELDSPELVTDYVHYQLDIRFISDSESVFTTRDGEEASSGGMMLSELNPISAGIGIRQAALHERLIPNVRYFSLPDEEDWPPNRVLAYRRLDKYAEPNPAIRHDP